ncbi:transcriptional regulator family: Fungal Specific TF [Penicillium argentinense]|uniref:Transcriptional regulator family: Fungal Specific TF n=1 Tax=Penicillium argentinense TaxID=1131581 RepID=A0A9W9EQP8_9EURO|nr:transcriptional regulator family: Fungal Specific TF [Penicillium argentinense]KAJ5086149.1 transcriptional regulator family: Fungal Specific TF [Penicillium argentinense]
MSSACIICHKRKVRCDLATHNPCTNCNKSDVECRPYTRKRKRFTNSLSPRRSAPASDPLSRRSSQLPVDAPREAGVAPRLSEAGTYEGDALPSEASAVPLNNGEPAIKEESYRGRSEYLGGSVPFDENMVKPGHETTYTSPKASAADLQMLREQGAFELPPEYVQRELMDSFNKYCLPWTPVIEPKWLDESTPPSMLLLQSIFLAGSRVTKAHLDYASSEVFYRRAKLLFFFGGGNNSLISIVAACLLHWYNPVGPEDVSTDTSGFWIRTAGAMAFQIGLHKEPPPNARNRGLRRRLWWSLVIRDNVISVGVGRPRTINLRDSDVLPPSMNDFPAWNFQAQLFLAYCTISCHLGDTVECYLRREISRQRRVDLENAVYRWAKQVFPKLRSSAALQEDAITSHHEVQQLLVMYFVVLTILHRSPVPNSVPPAASLVASSFIAGIYEGFLLRDELRYLGPVFAFYPLCAGLSLLSSWRYTQLQSTAEHELTVMKLSLQKLSERWLSAVGPLRALNKLTEKVREQGPFDGPSPTLDIDAASFFEGFDMKLCKQWALIAQSSDSGSNAITEPTCTLADVQEADDALPSYDTRPDDTVDNYNFPPLETNLEPFSTSWEGSGFDWSGSWLLNV